MGRIASLSFSVGPYSVNYKPNYLISLSSGPEAASKKNKHVLIAYY